MVPDEVWGQLRRLMIGLADQETRQRGTVFVYDGGRLYPDEVADLGLPSVLCIAQSLADRLGLGDLGYDFKLQANGAGFPLVAGRRNTRKGFLEIAPLVTEVFEGEVLDCRDDLAKLFEAAAKLVRPDFNMARDTNHSELAS